MDVWAHYPYNIYVIVLVSMPSYLFLIVGMSQVMLSVECIIKYKNFEINESEVASYCVKQNTITRNNKVLKAIYISIGLFSLTIIVGFAIFQMTSHIKAKKAAHPFVAELPLAILNLIVWVFLALSTCSFVNMINRRFGKDFANAKCKLFSVLTVFSLSFLIRASWDFYIQYNPDLQFSNNRVWSSILFSMYFWTEWLPLAVVLMTHFCDFYRNLQNEKNPPKDKEDLKASVIMKQE